MSVILCVIIVFFCDKDFSISLLFINFIDIKIPLPGVPDNIVTAIYPFKGETPEDLVFDEGEKITVLSRISQDWLYGECKDRKGQFPVNYVNRIPCNLPLHMEN